LSPNEAGDSHGRAGQESSIAAAPGDQRTPDKTIGEVKYARGQSQSGKGKGGAGDPQASDLEPEKQGGIGGP
jgi:hypothetical protein